MPMCAVLHEQSLCVMARRCGPFRGLFHSANRLAWISLPATWAITAGDNCKTLTFARLR